MGRERRTPLDMARQPSTHIAQKQRNIPTGQRRFWLPIETARDVVGAVVPSLVLLAKARLHESRLATKEVALKEKQP